MLNYKIKIGSLVRFLDFSHVCLVVDSAYFDRRDVAAGVEMTLKKWMKLAKQTVWYSSSEGQFYLILTGNNKFLIAHPANLIVIQ